MIRARRVGWLVAILLLLSVAPARADFKRVDDRADTHGRLDIKWVRQGHDYGRIRYAISTFGNYTEQDLEHGRFIFRFDIDADRGFERFAVVHWRDWDEAEGGKLAAVVKNAKRKIIGRVGVAHWTGNKLRVWIRRGLLEHPTRYRMDASSEWRRGPCERASCIDGVPEDGDFVHRLWPLCFGYDPTIVGSAGDDLIHGTKGYDLIYGWDGDDRIETAGGDSVCGGEGSDVIVGSEAGDGFRGGPGNDSLRVRGARTTSCKGNGPCPEPRNVAFGGPGNDLLVGGADSDELFGESGDDRIYGYADYDDLYGGPGHDFMDGGRSNDECYGGEVEQRC